MALQKEVYNQPTPAIVDPSNPAFGNPTPAVVNQPTPVVTTQAPGFVQKPVFVQEPAPIVPQPAPPLTPTEADAARILQLKREYSEAKWPTARNEAAERIVQLEKELAEAKAKVQASTEVKWPNAKESVVATPAHSLEAAKAQKEKLAAARK